MSVRNILWTERALRRLDSIGEHIAKDNSDAAAIVIARILSSEETLAEHPAMGRPGRIAGTRENVIASLPDIIAYRVRPEAIEVLTVLHGAQQWPQEV
ncbi:MAG: toxin Y4kP [Hyphomicrobiales bacterium]|nr:toxin Y4kP [Hyphomicrobiales bacterium]